MKDYKILALDGGGVRGALTIHLIARLAEKHPPFIEQTNLFVGVSTGAFIALGLANGLDIKKILTLYKPKKLKTVFSPAYINLLRPRYDVEGLKKLLADVFSTKLKLKDLASRTVIPTFKFLNTNQWQTKLFHNFPCSSTREKKIINTAIASSAAPTYFPACKNYIDGGVTANNPSLTALAAVRNNLKLPLAKIKILSIGTGIKPATLNHDGEWGIFQWAINPTPPPRFPLLEILTEGNKKNTTNISKKLLGNQYLRLNPKLEENIGLDNYKQVPKLIKLARNYNLDPTLNWLQKHWE